ncbi:hypothetical protein IU429_02700 [Nocardia elegans]|uniref:RES domain-containing protein n=1 Tax=Nocardia elegans TaxID=300029 RepID=A0ABW6TE28_9NOCA|nr:hypothetical protein [Nocardia elegans]MBF6446571.1 hypothetical protein [Nocardia elegans]
MSEQQDVIDDLQNANVLGAIRWAYVSATDRTLATYSEADGHDAAWLGTTRFTLFRDRLDRVSAAERYATTLGNDDADLDLLYAELSDVEAQSMPHLPPGTMRRSNLNGSPGWAHGDCRFLLAAFTYGGVDTLPWPRKSPTKQRVAAQKDPDPNQASLFEDTELANLAAALYAEHELDMRTFVVAHSLNPVTEEIELVFGRPRLNAGGGPAWHWREDLLRMPPADGGRRIGDTPLPTGPNSVPDAPVRLRPSAQKQPNDRASGER